MPHVSGVIVTPACDLMNRKVDTATYLPVLSVRELLRSRSFLPEVLRTIDGQLTAGGVSLRFDSDPVSVVAHAATARALDGLVTERLESRTLAAKERAALLRAQAGITVAQAIVSADVRDLVSETRLLLGEKELNNVVTRVVTNSYRTDLHFLPPDEQRPEWSLITEPSVTLFRYPLTLPLDVLDIAASADETAWTQSLRGLEPLFPCVSQLTRRPVKSLRIRPRFLSDLLTRFTALFGRLGSPDFSTTSVSRYVIQICGAS